MHQERTRRSRCIDPTAPSPAADASRYVRCVQCNGSHGKRQCPICHGLGYLRPDRTPDAEQTFPVWLPEVADFLAWYGRIQRYGVEGALALERQGGEILEFDPLFPEALDFFSQTLDDLEYASQVEDAEDRRKKLAAAKRG